MAWQSLPYLYLNLSRDLVTKFVWLVFYKNTQESATWPDKITA